MMMDQSTYDIPEYDEKGKKKEKVIVLDEENADQYSDYFSSKYSPKKS